jgi:hypothetical protein
MHNAFLSASTSEKERYRERGLKLYAISNYCILMNNKFMALPQLSFSSLPFIIIIIIIFILLTTAASQHCQLKQEKV